MKYHVTIDGVTRVVERIAAGLRLEDRDVSAELHAIGPHEVHLEYDGATHHGFVHRIDGGWRIQIRGRTFDIAIEDERTRSIRELAGDPAADLGVRELRAPMPGLVIRVLVEPGQQVESGDKLVVIEAMKMENELRAEGAGIVADVMALAGSPVDRDDVLVTFEERG